MALVCHLILCLLTVSIAGAVLDGAKFPRPSLTRLKSTQQGVRVEFPSGGLLKRHEETSLKAVVENSLVRRKRDGGGNCGFDDSNELEISPVSWSCDNQS